jgi:hypothetical protein
VSGFEIAILDEPQDVYFEGDKWIVAITKGDHWELHVFELESEAKAFAGNHGRGASLFHRISHVRVR